MKCMLCNGELKEVIPGDGNRYYEYSDHVCTECGQEYTYDEVQTPMLTDDQKKLLLAHNKKK